MTLPLSSLGGMLLDPPNLDFVQEQRIRIMTAPLHPTLRISATCDP